MKARLISGTGAEGTAAVVEIDGQEYECMDCLAYGRARAYKRGDVIYVRFSAGLLKKDRRGRAVTAPNPEQRKELRSLGGWRYRAYGVVAALEPETILDCGAVTVEMGRAIEELNAIGTFVAIDVDRLDCWRGSGP